MAIHSLMAGSFNQPSTSMIGVYKHAMRDDPCAYCGHPADVLDHIVPYVQFGAGTWDNFTAACNGCNSRKHGRTLLGYLGWEQLHAHTDHIVEPLLLERSNWGKLGGPRREKGWRP